MKAGIGQLRDKYIAKRDKIESYTSALNERDEGSIDGKITVYDDVIDDLSDITWVGK